MNQNIKFEDNIGLVHLNAKFGFKWAQGAGLSLAYDDLFQEASIAFLLAAEGYSPETGLKFSTYYTAAAFSQFRKVVGVMSGVKNLNPTQRAEIAARKEENKQRAKSALPPLYDINYGLNPVMFSHLTGPDMEGGNAFEESLNSGVMSPEEIYERKQELENATANLSPLAQLVVEWMRDPPPELMKELNCQMAHADKCVELHLRPRGMRDGLTPQNITKFLKLMTDVPDDELTLVKKELDKLTKCFEED